MGNPLDSHQSCIISQDPRTDGYGQTSFDPCSDYELSGNCVASERMDREELWQATCEGRLFMGIEASVEAR